MDRQSLLGVQGRIDLGEPHINLGGGRIIFRDGDTLKCTLHGRAIVEKNGNTITLRTFGIRTPSVLRGLVDFSQTLGLRVGVSFSKGQWSVKALNVTHKKETASEDEEIKLTIDRSCQKLKPDLWVEFKQLKESLGKGDRPREQTWTVAQVRAYINVHEKSLRIDHKEKTG